MPEWHLRVGSSLADSVSNWSYKQLTLQLVPVQTEVCQLGEVADGLRPGDGACVWAREFLCRH